MNRKKHHFKRILACLMVVIMTLTAVPLSGFVGLELPKLFETKASAYYTEGNLKYSVYNGEATITDCDTSISGELVIPDTLGGYPVTSIGYDAFYGCTGLTSITIPDSVTIIGEDAFYNCTGLTSITIPDSVTSIVSYAFENCTGLTSVTIGNSVTRIGEHAFDYCTGLTSVTIPNSVTSIGEGAFAYCTGLTSITIPDGVTSIGEDAFANTAWYNTQPFGDVYVGKFYYKYKGTMLENTSVLINDGTKGIADSAFEDCTGLTSITIPDSVKNIGDTAFNACYGLTRVNISDLASWCKIEFESPYSNPLRYARLYINGNLATNITIPDSVTSIGDFAFYGCTILTSVTIPDSVTELGTGAFKECTNLTSVTIGNGVETIKGYIVYEDYVESCGTFEGCPLTIIKIGKNVKTIEDNAFNGIKSIPEVYYAGSEEDWKNVAIDQSNDMILRATMYYNADITHTHSYTSETTKKATCTENGTKTFTCDCGKTYSETIPATGHKFSSWITDKAATCTADGSKHKECTVCKTKLETATISATGHSFKTETVAATCTSIGYVTKTCSKCGETQFVKSVPAIGHSFKTTTVAATCTSIGYVTKTCSKCGETQFVKSIPAIGHSTKTAVVSPATESESGLSITSCKTCGTITKATLIKRIASVSLSKTAFTYNGKVQTPTVTVKDSSGKVLKNGTDYTVKYSSGRKNPGQYSVTVTFKGNYSGTKTLTYTIAPGTPTLSVTAGAKKATLKWTKRAEATGYVVYMATSKNGKYTKIATLKGNTKVSYTKTGLTKGKTYYFKVAAYETVGGKNIYGSFSSVKYAKIK